MFILETKRLTLRDFSPVDFDPFFETTRDPRYQQFYSEGEMERPFWQKFFDGLLADGADPARKKFQLAVCLNTGELVGTCGVRIEAPEHQQASFGCAIGSAYWGKGYAYEAAHALFAYGFAELPIYRIYAETNSKNISARALAERLGMRLEGEFHGTRYFRGRWWNTVVYAILKDEWGSAAQGT